MLSIYLLTFVIRGHELWPFTLCDTHTVSPVMSKLSRLVGMTLGEASYSEAILPGYCRLGEASPGISHSPDKRCHTATQFQTQPKAIPYFLFSHSLSIERSAKCIFFFFYGCEQIYISSFPLFALRGKSTETWGKGERKTNADAM